MAGVKASSCRQQNGSAGPWVTRSGPSIRSQRPALEAPRAGQASVSPGWHTRRSSSRRVRSAPPVSGCGGTAKFRPRPYGGAPVNSDHRAAPQVPPAARPDPETRGARATVSEHRRRTSRHRARAVGAEAKEFSGRLQASGSRRVRVGAMHVRPDAPGPSTMAATTVRAVGAGPPSSLPRPRPCLRTRWADCGGRPR